MAKLKAAIVAKATLKRPASAKRDAEEAAEATEAEVEEDQDVAEEADEPEEAEEVDEAEEVERAEAELQASRRKELKAMYVDELKSLAAGLGLQSSKRIDIIEAVICHEAKGRAEIREHAVRIRSAVVVKKQELEAAPWADLLKQCTSLGFGGKEKKDACVEKLLKHWQDNDGIDKALAKMAHDKRKGELMAIDKAALREICDAASVDPFVKEVMADRILKRELAAGRFARPSLEEEDDEEAPKQSKKGDMVDAILQNEAARKRERELKQQQDEAAAAKLKELRAMSIEDLKAALAKVGAAVAGKKDELVQALLASQAQAEAVAARRAKLAALAIGDLQKRVEARGLKAGKKNDMLNALLQREAEVREELRAYGGKIEAAMAKKKEELDEKTNGELKELCADKGLKLGVGKEERVERLLEEARTSGEIDQAIAIEVRDARTAELLAMDKAALLELCGELGADPLVKEVMVERILSHETGLVDEGPVEAPAAKRARKGKA